MLDGRLLAPAGSGSERRGGGWARRPSDMSVALGRADSRSLPPRSYASSSTQKKVMQSDVDGPPAATIVGTSHVRHQR